MQTGFAVPDSKVGETADEHAKLVESRTQLFAFIERHSKWLQRGSDADRRDA
jgi:hypothetical protein